MASEAANRGVGAPRLQVINLATGNAHKVAEFQRLADASGLGLRVVAAAKMPPVVEDTGTFAGNARKKAQALKALLPPEAWVLADDSGVCVDALGGAPGVESAYYAGPEHNANANLDKLAAVMRTVPDGARTARFVCVLLLLGPEGRELTFEGRCEGALAREPVGERGFGYDPLFVPAGGDRTYAELTESEKNRISHRSLAWRQLAAALRAGLA